MLMDLNDWLYRQWDKHRLRTLAAAAIATLLLCCVLTVFVAALLPSTSTPTPAANVAAALVADSTPAAPVTLDDPAPTAAANPSAATAEQDYATEIVQITTGLGQTMISIGERTGEAADDNSLLFDDNWKTETGSLLGIVNVYCQRIRHLKPPARFVAMHNELVTAAGHFEDMTRLYAEGVDELDTAKLLQAGKSADLANAAIRRANEELQSALNTPSAAPAASASGPTAATGSNLRAGPGTTFARVGGVKAGQALAIVARNPAGDWYKLASGAWIKASLVTHPPTAADLPVAEK